RIAAADPCGAAGREAAVLSLRAPVSELHHRTFGRAADTRRFRGDQCLEVQDVQKRRFDKLGVEDRTLNAEQWLVGEDRMTFRDGVDVEFQPEFRQIVDELWLEQRAAVFSKQSGKVG